MPKYATEYEEMFERLRPYLEAGIKPPELREQIQHLLSRFQFVESRLPEFQDTLNAIRKLCHDVLPEGTREQMFDTDQLVELVIAKKDEAARHLAAEIAHHKAANAREWKEAREFVQRADVEKKRSKLTHAVGAALAIFAALAVGSWTASQEIHKAEVMCSRAK